MMSVEYNNIEKLSIFFHDLKRSKISLHAPCINESKNSFSIEKSKNNDTFISYSLSSLKNVGNEAVSKIVETRNEKGLFKNIDDFLNKVPFNCLGRKLFESLIKSGAFDCLEPNRNKLYNSIDLMLNYSHSLHKEKISNQENLFDVVNKNELSIKIPETLDWSLLEKLNNEFTTLGMYLTSHQLDNFSSVLKNLEVVNSSDLIKTSNESSKKNIRLCGLIFKIQKRQSSRGKWAIIYLNDLEGDFEVTLYNDILIKHEKLIDEQKPLLIDAEIKYEINQGYRIIAKRLRSLDEYISNAKLNLTIVVKDLNSIKVIGKTLETLVFGPSAIYFTFEINGKFVRIKAKENIKFTENFIEIISKIKGVKSAIYS